MYPASSSPSPRRDAPSPAPDMRGEDIELVIYGSCSNDELVPNSASGVQQRIGAHNAASFDVNTACTSFMYGLSIGSSMIKSGIVKNALVIGVELISQYMDWDNRNVAVLFGDGAAAVVLQDSQHESGVIAEKLQCYADCAADAARARHGHHVRQPRRAVRTDPLGLRRTGNLSQGRARHERGQSRRDAPRRRDHG